MLSYCFSQQIMVEDNKQGMSAVAEFQMEFGRCWSQLPNKGFFFGLLALWVALFHFLGNSTFGYVDTSSLFMWMYNTYSAPSSEDGHGTLIPFVVLGLFWWKRKEFEGIRKELWAPAHLGVLVGLFLHIVGYVAQQPRICIIGFFTGLFSLMGLAWGREWMKKSLFPFVLFAFCIPIGSLSESLTFPLRMLATMISVGVTQTVLGLDVIRDGTMLFDSRHTFQYDVAPACSGIRSLITLFALTTIYSFVSFKTVWKRGLTIMLSIPLAVAGNVLRIVGVIMATEAFGKKAGQLVHDWEGYLTFLLALGVIMALGSWLREDAKTPASEAVQT